MSILSDLQDSAQNLPGEFADVAAQGPVESALLAMGAFLVFAPMIGFGYLVLGAVLELLRPDSSAVQNPPGR